VLNDLLYLKYEDADESDELHLRRKSVFTALANQQKRFVIDDPQMCVGKKRTNRDIIFTFFQSGDAEA
jgi:hypothetical protein